MRQTKKTERFQDFTQHESALNAVHPSATFCGHTCAKSGGVLDMLISDRLIAWPARIVACVLTLALCGCAGDQLQSSQPSFYRTMAQADAELDSAAAASMISGYRQNNGLGPVTVDPELTQLAEAQSRAMVAKDKLDHNVAGSLKDRIKKSGYDARTAVENISAGYHTLAEAFSGWRDSPPHKANMLNRSATRMGIAAVYAPDSKYKVFWTLVMAKPDTPS